MLLHSLHTLSRYDFHSNVIGPIKHVTDMISPGMIVSFISSLETDLVKKSEFMLYFYEISHQIKRAF